jgi:uncharacterized cupredoxin-like copper-binding protein
MLKTCRCVPIPAKVSGTLHRRAGISCGVLASIVALLAAGACGGGRPQPAGIAVVHLTERDFKISAPAVVRSGNVRIEVRNDGPDLHELIVVHAPPDGELPMRPDGLTVDEDALDRVKVGSLEPGAPGSVRDLRLHLAPGRYEVFCNMGGHYMGGMHAVITVQ